MFESLLNAFRAPDIRRRILYVLALLIVFRLLAAVPVPGIDRKQLADFVSGNALVGLLDLFSGGGLSHFEADLETQGGEAAALSDPLDQANQNRDLRAPTIAEMPRRIVGMTNSHQRSRWREP